MAEAVNHIITIMIHPMGNFYFFAANAYFRFIGEYAASLPKLICSELLAIDYIERLNEIYHLEFEQNELTV